MGKIPKKKARVHSISKEDQQKSRQIDFQKDKTGINVKPPSAEGEITDSNIITKAFHETEILYLIAYVTYAILCLTTLLSISVNLDLNNIEKFLYTGYSSNVAKADNVDNLRNVLDTSNQNLENESSHSQRKIKNILLWTTYFGNREFEFGLGQKPFVDARCKVDMCSITSNKADFQNSDAVLFHMRDFRERMKPKAPRPAGQRWVFVLKESPWLSYVHQFKNMKSEFNMTMTYRMDSDIPWLYGTFREMTDREKSEATKNLDGKDFSTGKTKMAAWVVSRCPRISERDEYAKELNKFAPVDIYGRCGTLQCSPRRGTDWHGSCFDAIRRDYRFYLAFENSLCPDYATEKFFRSFEWDLIPVALGGADYAGRLRAPPHSYIDVRDFPSPRHLARHLKYLAKNATAYNEYFAWRRTHKVVTTEEMSHGMCSLCEALHEAEDAKTVHHYEDIQAWWTRSDCNASIFDLLEDLHRSDYS